MQWCSTVLIALLDVVIPAYLIVGVGAVFGWRFRPMISQVNRLALYAASPALVFDSIYNADVGLNNVLQLISGNALFLVFMGLLAWVTTWRFSEHERRGVVATSVFGNAANLMLPVSLFAFGQDGLHRALILFVFTSVLIYSVAPVVLTGLGRGKERNRLGGVLRLPVLWAAVAALSAKILGLDIPLAIARGVELLGGAAIPIVLLALGIQVQRAGIRLPSRLSALAAALRLIAGPCVAYVAGLVVGARGMDLAILTLLGGMPPAVMMFVLAVEYEVEAEEIASTVILATFTAVLTLPVIVHLLQRIAV